MDSLEEVNLNSALMLALKNIENLILISEAHKLGMVDEETYRSYIVEMMKASAFNDQ